MRGRVAIKTYQDQWVKGRLIGKGIRECASRYEIIKSFCAQYNRPFSVCDIGANMCYFGLRLTEDFPTCSVVSFEFDNFKLRAAHVKKNDPTRLLLLNHKLNLDDLSVLASSCRFDVVLVLSVLHHVFSKKSPIELDAWLKEVRGLGDNIIAEFAGEDSRTPVKFYPSLPDAKILGYGKSHLVRGVQRPIVLIPGTRNEHDNRNPPTTH